MTLYSLDLETYDPHLTSLGTDAHCRRWGGYVFMLQLLNATTKEATVYRWDDETKNMLRDLFEAGGNEFIGHNIKYDLGWLLSEGVLKPHHTKHNRFRDTQVYAALIDETRTDVGHYS